MKRIISILVTLSIGLASTAAIAGGECIVVWKNDTGVGLGAQAGSSSSFRLMPAHIKQVDGVSVPVASPQVQMFRGQSCSALFDGKKITLHLMYDQSQAYTCTIDSVSAERPSNEPIDIHIVENSKGYQCFVNQLF